MAIQIQAGHEYTCDLVASAMLFGKHDVRVVVDVDTPTSFHGYGHLKSGSVSVLGMKFDASQRLEFDGGVIDGSELSCSIGEGSMSASFKAQLAGDGSVKGTAQAMGLLRLRLDGKVVSVEPIA